MAVQPFSTGRRVLSPIDLRDPGADEQILRIGQNFANLFETIGKAEQTRRERQQLDRVATAIAGGASTIEAINAVANQPAELDTGIRGVLQKIGGAFQPGGGGIRQDLQMAIIGQALQKASTPQLLSPEEQTQAAKIKAGILPKTKEADTALEIEQQKATLEATKALTEKRRRLKAELSDIEIREKEADIDAAKALAEKRRRVKAELTEVEKQQQQAKLELTRARTQKALRPAKAKKPAIFNSSERKNIRTNLGAALENVEKTPLFGPLRKAVTQESLIEKYKAKANEISYSDLSRKQQKQFDAMWDNASRIKHKSKQGTLDKSLGGGKVKLGWNPNSPEVKAARQELRQQTRPFTEGDVRLTRPPDIRLEEFWDALPDDEKKEIIQRLDENPDNIEEILRILKRG